MFEVPVTLPSWSLYIPFVTAGFFLIGGASIATIYWKRSSNKRYSLRLIDLWSYGLSAVGLAASFLYVLDYSYITSRDSKLNTLVNQRRGITAVLDGSIAHFCWYFPEKATPNECDEMHAYLVEAEKYNDHDPALPPPLKPFPQNNAIVRGLEHVPDQYFNNRRQAFLKNQQPESERRLPSVIVVVAALQLLAFTFGLGIARRAIDAYQERSRGISAN